MLVMIAFIDHLHILQYFGGDIWFTLSSFLHRSPLAVIFFGATLCVIAACTPKNVSRILLVLYLAFIAYMTLLFREPGSGNPIPAPFWSYRLFFSNRIIRRQILNNIWLFIPLGALLGRLFPRNRFIFFVPTLVSVTIEASQYFGSACASLMTSSAIRSEVSSELRSTMFWRIGAEGLNDLEGRMIIE